MSRCGVTILLVLTGAAALQADEASPAVPPQRPVALALSADEKHLLVANGRAGTISILDTDQQRVVGEFTLGGRITDLAVARDGEYVLAVDEEAHEVALLQCRGRDLELIQRRKVSPFPVSIQQIGGSPRYSIASLWSRRLSLVELVATKAAPELRITATIDLPFAPNRQLVLANSSRLLLADAFGGELAVIDLDSGALSHTVSLPGHNVRGLAINPDERWLLVAQQVLSPLARTVRDDIHWGNLIANVIRRVPLNAVLAPGADVLAGSSLFHLGDVGHGSGDPAGLAITADGTLVVSLGGINETAVVRGFGQPPRRTAVGRRPTAVRVTSDGARAFVANTHAGSISIISLPDTRLEAEVSLGPPVEMTAAERGELLFYDAGLSHDGWLSCHSCHTDGHTNGHLNDNLGDGSFGAPKRVLSLLGVGETGPWAWNGTSEELRAQIRKSIRTTMRSKQEPSEEQVQDLAAFLRTLSPPPSAPALVESSAPAAISRGARLFREQGCVRCHVPPNYTSSAVYDVGLVDEVGNRRFNPPSLRGAGQRSSFLHDGRAQSLMDVLGTHRHGLPEPLPEESQNDLVSFLNRL